MKKSCLLICSIVICFCTTFGQVLEEIPLSRQDSALLSKYESKATEQTEKDNLKEASDFFNQIAMLYWEHNHFNDAIHSYEKSLVINNALGNENGIAMINSNLALLYADMRKYDKSLEKFTTTYSIRKAKNEKVGTISALINMSVVLNNLKDYQTSISNLKEALDIAREMSDINQMKSCYGMLSETYEKFGKPDSAFYYFNFYKTFNEMVHETKLRKTRHELENERLKAKLAEAESQKKEFELYKSEIELNRNKADLESVKTEKGELLESLSKKELQLKVLQNNSEIEHLKSTNEIKQKEKLNIIIFGISGFLVVLFLILYYFYNQKKIANKSLKSANRRINQKNEETISSLNYAKYLQDSMLGKSNDLNKLVNDSFIIYKPKDIVGGDFYWFTKIENKTVIAAIDCTGHGVPGAFLTVMSNDLLNQIIVRDKIFDPSKILHIMDQDIIEKLNQRTSNNSDGMSVGLVVIEGDKMKYAGAENKLIYVEDNEVKIIKGYRHGLGGIALEERNIKKEYITHELTIKKDMPFYLSSDGFVDQLGGSEFKRIKTSRFLKIIAQIHNYTMTEQSDYLLKKFEEWKKDYEQIDDVLIIGFKA